MSPGIQDSIGGQDRAAQKKGVADTDPKKIGGTEKEPPTDEEEFTDPSTSGGATADDQDNATGEP
jgi:hypothetical protein